MQLILQKKVLNKGKRKNKGLKLSSRYIYMLSQGFNYKMKEKENLLMN